MADPIILPGGLTPITDPVVVDPGLESGESGEITKPYTYNLNDDVLQKLCDIATDGTKTITANGEGIDVKRFAAVDVLVPGEQLPEYEGSTYVTSNGTLQTANKKVTSNITVNVAQPANYTGSYTITNNGTIAIANKKATQDIVVDVPGSGPSLDSNSLYYVNGDSEANKIDDVYENYLYFYKGDGEFTQKDLSSDTLYYYSGDGDFEGVYLSGYQMYVYEGGAQFSEAVLPDGGSLVVWNNSFCGGDWDYVELPDSGQTTTIEIGGINYNLTRAE